MKPFYQQEFLRIYRGTESFVSTEQKYYNLFLELLKDKDLLDKIRFANDALGVPPIKSFILYHRNCVGDNVFNSEMSATAKRGLGACFGYLYRFMYDDAQYEAEQTWFNDQ